MIKSENKGAKERMNKKMAESLGVVHTHTHIFIRK